MSSYAEFSGPFELREEFGDCPYCGEPLSILVDPENIGSDYVEDCQVCCCPMVVRLWLDDRGQPQMDLCREDQ